MRHEKVDDARLLRLLWRADKPAEPRPGPKAQLTLPIIVAAGIAVADERDGTALSMRLVADRLGCTPMALYSYVDGRHTLLRLMYDAAHAEFGPSGAGPAAAHVSASDELVSAVRASDGPAPVVSPEGASAAGGGPRDEVTAGASAWGGIQAWVDALLDLYARHRWLADVSWARPVLGPHEQEVLESLLRHLQPLALAPAHERTIASALLTLGRHSGRLIADARHAQRVTGTSDERWWLEQSATMRELVPDFAQRFPLSARTDSSAEVEESGDSTSQGYLERAVRAQLRHAVRLLIRGAVRSERR